ncbi:MAG TPA: hypothetical protein VFI02_06115, partial [Armatimonadota bacterium]|nr:hypothetical protein [Armatimonadota bacterium]
MEQTAAPQIKIAHVWSDKPLAKTGDTIKFSAWVENPGDKPASAEVRQGDQARKVSVEPGSYERVDWQLKASTPGNMEIKVVCGDQTAEYRILVIDRSSKLSRQELCTDNSGYWRILDRPATLQQDNSASLTPIKHKKSSEIKHNTYGICTHVPRSRDYEDPFNPS